MIRNAILQELDRLGWNRTFFFKEETGELTVDYLFSNLER